MSLTSAVLVSVSLACQQPAVESLARKDAAAPTSAAGGHGGDDAPPAPVEDARFALPDVAAADAAAGVLDASCAADVYKANAVPVDLVFVIDQSPSMLYTIATPHDGTRTKWALARESLLGFFGDPRSSGLGVGLQFFPIRAGTPPCADDRECGLPLACANGTCSHYPFDGYPSCAAADYVTLAVPIADLPGSRPTLERVIRMREPYASVGVSALGVAADGVFRNLRAREKSQPGRRMAVVLVTDGVPSGCFYGWVGVDEIEAGLKGEAARTPSIPTFVIGLFSSSTGRDADAPAALARFAVAGGTRAPFIVRPPDDVNAKLQDALSQIREATLPCEYQIPAPTRGELDLSKVNLHFKDSAGERDLVFVGTRDRCDAARGGWFYDAPVGGAVAPTRVIACDATCRTLTTGGKAEVSLTFGCQTRMVE